MCKILQRLIAILLFVLFNTTVFASTYFYTNKAEWLSDVSGVVSDDYESHGWTGGYSTRLLDNNQTINIGGVTYSISATVADTQRTLYAVKDLTFDAAYLTGTYLEWQDSRNQLVMEFPYAVHAVALIVENSMVSHVTSTFRLATDIQPQFILHRIHISSLA